MWWLFFFAFQILVWGREGAIKTPPPPLDACLLAWVFSFNIASYNSRSTLSLGDSSLSRYHIWRGVAVDWAFQWQTSDNVFTFLPMDKHYQSYFRFRHLAFSIAYVWRQYGCVHWLCVCVCVCSAVLYALQHGRPHKFSYGGMQAQKAPPPIRIKKVAKRSI